MNFLFLITFKEVDYDQVGGYVICAETIDEAKSLANIRKEKGDIWENTYESNIDLIEQIGIAYENIEKGIILEDFRAG
jgi:hypothetical protein